VDELVHWGSQKQVHEIQRLGRCYGPSPREAVKQNAETEEVVEMPVGYIDGLQVAVMERNPIRESLGFSHRGQCFYHYRVVITEDQSRRDRVEAERFTEALWPFADHRLSRGGKDVDTKLVRSHARGLLKPEFPFYLSGQSIP
jgi:hypothetical protein